MNRSGVVLGVGSVLAGTSVLMVVLGITFNLVFVVAAVPFAAAAYVLWFDATGKLEERMRERARRADGGARARQRRRRAGRDRTRSRDEPPEAERASADEARAVLGVGPDADEAAIREAYRERAKELHPDTEGGDEEAFKRVTDAYERLR